MCANAVRSLISLGDWPAGVVAEWLDRTRHTHAHEFSAPRRHLKLAAIADEIPAVAREFITDSDATGHAELNLGARFVYAHRFQPRTPGCNPKATGWSKLFRGDASRALAGVGPAINLGSSAHDPLRALAILAAIPDAAFDGPMMLAWHGATNADLNMPNAPVATPHEILFALAALARGPIRLVQPEGFALEPEIVAAVERTAYLRGHSFDVAFDAGTAAHWAAGCTAIALPWGSIEHYDDIEAARGAMNAAHVGEWKAVADAASHAVFAAGASWHRAAIMAALEWVERSESA